MNPFSMLIKSISKAAADSTYKPGVLQPWVDEIENKVATDGKFTKLQVLYLPFSVPPAFWDYKCKKCRFWEEPDGCTVVEGKISPQGWCAIWLPPEDYEPFTWPKELLKGNW